MALLLNMIVKNEAAILERCLASVAPWIDGYVIADTGSTDGTEELATSFMKAQGIPGEIVRFPFEDFSQARNAALEACRRSIKVPRTDHDHILLTDADMELRVEDPAWRSQLGAAPAHMITQEDKVWTYDNTRVVERSLAARYVGATHEYLDCGFVPACLDGVWLLDHASGASRGEKTERDLRLLEAEVSREPTNARARFYLAQTLKDAGRFEEALQRYEERVHMGGFEEEAWYSLYMSAVCHRELKNEPAFMHAALRAYQRRPSRLEPLYVLAKYLRERGDAALASVFASYGATLPFPVKDLLFVEHGPYDHGIREELSITGFYSPSPVVRKEGREECLALAEDRTAPRSVRQTAIDNTPCYAKRADVAFQAVCREIAIIRPGDRSWSPMNPSVAVNDQGNLRAVLRWVNYTTDGAGHYLPTDGSNIIRTRNDFLLFPDPDRATPSTVRPIEESDAVEDPSLLVRGSEDLRLFRWRGGWWAVAAVRDRNPTMRAEVCLLELANVCRRHMLRFHPEHHQKNWVPLVRGDELLLVYSADPTTILQVNPDTYEVTVIKETVPEVFLENLRGSSQAVPFNLLSGPGYLYVAHEAFVRGGRRYTHRLVWLDEALRIRHVSAPFFFQKSAIEFCAGLVVLEDKVIMSFGSEDRSAWLATAPRDAVTTWLLDR